MKIYGIKARKVYACHASWANVAEAEIDDNEGKTAFVTAQEYDGTDLTVSRKSVYDFMVEDLGEPVEEFVAEFTTWKDAKASEYGEVFDKLKKAIKMLG